MKAPILEKLMRRGWWGKYYRVSSKVGIATISTYFTVSQYAITSEHRFNSHLTQRNFSLVPKCEALAYCYSRCASLLALRERQLKTNRKKSFSFRKISNPMKQYDIVYFSFCGRREQGKIKFLHGWCERIANKGIRRDTGMYATLDCSVGATKICKTIRSAQVCETKFKTAWTVFQDCTWFPGTVREQRKASHFVFNCPKFPYLCCNTLEQLDGGCRDMAGGAAIKYVTWWKKTLIWRGEDQWGYDNWMELCQNQEGCHAVWKGNGIKQQ